MSLTRRGLRSAPILSSTCFAPLWIPSSTCCYRFPHPLPLWIPTPTCCHRLPYALPLPISPVYDQRHFPSRFAPLLCLVWISRLGLAAFCDMISNSHVLSALLCVPLLILSSTCFASWLHFEHLCLAQRDTSYHEYCSEFSIVCTTKIGRIRVDELIIYTIYELCASS